MNQPNLTELLDHIKTLHPHQIDLSLHRILDLLEKIGSPHLHIHNIIHVAGTNGKGSTIAFLSDLLTTSGFSVNKYISPHVIHFCERIVLQNTKHSNEINITDYFLQMEEGESLLIDVFLYLLEKNEDNPITEFEFITCAAFYLFAKYPADYTLLEVGLGGEFDATNVIPSPLLSIITSISYDHVEYLGETLEEIAKAKGGIIKPKSQVILPQNLEKAAKDILLTIGQLNEATIYTAPAFEGLIALGLKGVHQLQNAGVAIKAFQVLLPSYAVPMESLARTQWIGRLQYISLLDLTEKKPQQIQVLLDGAHNEAGMQTLCQSLLNMYPIKQEFVIFLHIKKRKKFKEMLKHLTLLNAQIYIPVFEIDGGLSVSIEEINTEIYLHEMTAQPLYSMNHMREIMDQQIHPVLITGSLFWVGHCLQAWKDLIIFPFIDDIENLW